MNKCANMYRDYINIKQKYSKPQQEEKQQQNIIKNKNYTLCKNKECHIFLITSKLPLKNIKIYEFSVSTDIIAKHIIQNHQKELKTHFSVNDILNKQNDIETK